MPVLGDGAEQNQARAALYGVLAHLFLAAPSRDLLDRIASSTSLIDDDASPLSLAWRGLCDASRAADIAGVREEFDTVFVSPGRPEVSLYASSYMSGARRGHLLAELRGDLAQAGYVRAPGSEEYEDHLAALCEVMRGMVSDESADAAAYTGQCTVFQRYLAPWYGKVCDAINHSERTDFYRSVAKFANAYFTNESELFDLA